MDVRGDIIKNLLNAPGHISTDRVIYALFLCLTPEELGNLYTDSLNTATTIRNLAKKHILKRMEDCGINPFIPFIDRLFSLLETVEGRQKTSISVLLYELINYLPSNYVTKLFDMLIDSPRKSDRKRAYTVPNLIWSEERKDKLWQKWNEYHEDECLLALIQLAEVDSLLPLFKEIWESETISRSTKNKLLARLAKPYFEAIAYLRATHPISYLYGAVIACKNLSQAEAVKLALCAETRNEFEFALWCLGKLQQWDAIVEINGQLPQLEREFEKRRRAFYGLE